MKRIISHIILAFSTVVTVSGSYAGTLWVTDDTQKLYHITKTGELLFEFSVKDVADFHPSDVAVDLDGTLWVTTEEQLNQTIYRFNWDGTLKEEIQFGNLSHGGVSTVKLESIAIDTDNFRLWVVDDDNAVVHQLERDGTQVPNSSFFLNNPNCAMSDPQGIAFDKSDKTLWLSGTEKLIHINTDGSCVGTSYAEGTIDIPGLFPQGMTIDDENNSVWVAKYAGTSKIRHYRKNGSPLYSIRTRDTYEPNNKAATGVAFDPAYE